MSLFWSCFIIVLTLGSIFGCWWLIAWTTKSKKNEPKLKEHVWDGDLREYNNPLPRWWLWLFHTSLVFALIYLLLFPGLGNFEGLLGWSSQKQYQEQVKTEEQSYNKLYEAFRGIDLVKLSQNEDAMKMGRSLFANHCSTCHGTDAKGSPGFPNLTDNDWLYGGSTEQIKYSIQQGRSGVMVPLAAALGDRGVLAVTHYIKSLSDDGYRTSLVQEGKAKFHMYCAACHGKDAKGNQLLGAPNLSDDIWLYGGGEEEIVYSITVGRNGNMPAHASLLSEDKINLITAYVYQLSK